MSGRDLPDLDQRLRRLPAALAVDVPAGLAERIAQQGRRRRWLRRATAAAAVVVLLGGVAVTRSLLAASQRRSQPWAAGPGPDPGPAGRRPLGGAAAHAGHRAARRLGPVDSDRPAAPPQWRPAGPGQGRRDRRG
ncbi:MAG TPA: hypothetical protein VFN05_09060, partial [Actinomycetes bacterium]|nr:hypothetical protein [Actinomycetes bacterium]